MGAPGAAGLGHRATRRRSPAPICFLLSRPRARDHRRDPARRRRLPRDGHARSTRPRGRDGGALAHEAARLPDRRHRLPRHGGARAPARDGRPRGASRSSARADDAARRARASTACWPSCGATRRRTAAASAPCAGDLTAPGLGLGDRRAHERRRGDRRGPALRGLDLVRPAARRGARDQRRGHARDASASRARRRRAAAWSASCTSRPPTSAGRHEGTFRERQLDAGQDVPQHLRADQVRRPSTSSTTRRRPRARRSRGRASSMGESDSGWTPAFNVLYWPLRAFSRGLFDRGPGAARRRASTSSRSTTSPTRSCTCSTAREAGVVQPRRRPRRAARSTSSSSSPAAHFGRPRPPRRRSPARRTARHADEHGAVYFPYFDMDVVFDDSRARALLGPAGIAAPQLRRLLRRADGLRRAARWGKRPITREAARARRASPRPPKFQSHEPGYSAKRNRANDLPGRAAFPGGAGSLGSAPEPRGSR